MSQVPSDLQGAYDLLLQATSAVRCVDSPANQRDVRRAVQRFTQTLSGHPEAAAELKRRARFVASRTRAGSRYARVRSKSLIPKKHQPPMAQAHQGCDPASILRSMRKEKPFLAEQLAQEQSLIETLLNPQGGAAHLAPNVASSLAAWLAESERIESEAWLIEADGCWYLANPDYLISIEDVLASVERAAMAMAEWHGEQVGDDANWSRADDPGQFRKLTNLSPTTFWRKRKSGEIRTRKARGRQIQVYLPDFNKYRTP